MALTPDKIAAMDKVSGLSQDKIAAMDAALAQPTTQQPAQEKGLLSKIGSGAAGVGKAVFEAPIKLGSKLGEAASYQFGGGKKMQEESEAIRQFQSQKDIDIANKLRSEGKGEQAQALLQRSMAEDLARGQTATQQEQEAKKGVTQTIQGGLGTAAFFVPGGNSVKGMAASGALTGALTGASTGEDITAENVVGGALAGGAIGAGMGVLGKFAGKVGKKISEKAAEKAAKQAQKAATEGVDAISDTAAKSYAGIWQVPKNKGTRGLDPVRTAKELMDLDVQPSSIDDLVRKSESITGSDGVLSRGVRDAIGNIPEEIDVTNAGTAAKNILKGKLGMKDVGDDIARSIADITPTGKGVTTTNPLDAFEIQRQLQEQGAVYREAFKFSRDPKNRYIAEAYEAAAAEIGDQLDSKIGKYGVTQGLFGPEDIEKVRQVSPKLADKIQKVTTVRELRALQRPFVNAMRLAEQTNLQSSRILQQEVQRGVASTLGAATGSALGPLGMAAGGIAGSVAEPVVSSIAQRIRVPVATQAARGIQALSKTAPAIQNSVTGVQKALGRGTQALSKAYLNPFVQKAAVTGAVNTLDNTQ